MPSVGKDACCRDLQSEFDPQNHILKITILILVCVSVRACLYVCAPYTCRSPWRIEEVLAPPKLEL